MSPAVVYSVPPDRATEGVGAILEASGYFKRLRPKKRVGIKVHFGEHGNDHVRIALIENEHRLRQAARGIRDMFRKDGLLRGAA